MGTAAANSRPKWQRRVTLSARPCLFPEAVILRVGVSWLKAARRYWIPVALVGVVVLLTTPTRYVLDWLAMYATSALMLFILLRLAGEDRPPVPSLAGERWATCDTLRDYHWETWPQPAPRVSAGTLWEPQRRGQYRPIVYGIDAGPEGRHTLLVAPTGLGKGLWTTTQLLTWNGSAIVNDLKADTYPRTAGWRATLGPVYILSAAAPIHRFDPTAAARTEDDLRPLAFAACYDPEDRGTRASTPGASCSP
jgi:hypothetical protein